jgi:hypothetical protein
MVEKRAARRKVRDPDRAGPPPAHARLPAGPGLSLNTLYVKRRKRPFVSSEVATRLPQATSLDFDRATAQPELVALEGTGLSGKKGLT